MSNDGTWVYENPPRLILEDWIVWREEMQQEVEKYPTRLEAQWALRDAKDTIEWLKTDPFGLSGKQLAA